MNRELVAKALSLIEKAAALLTGGENKNLQRSTGYLQETIRIIRGT